MITKKIWMYWHQGWEHAPGLVLQCKDSWQHLNPDYEVYALDRDSIADYADLSKCLDLNREDLTLQKLAALNRLVLLKNHGGVWVDATALCAQPLSQWIENYYQSRFFAFRDPGKDRLMSNWMIAAEPESLILQKLHAEFLAFYTDNVFSNQNTPVGKLALRLLRRRWQSSLPKTTRWHSWFARKVLRVYPYFIFHYTFNKVILENPECAQLWNQGASLSAQPAHRVQRLAREADGIENAKREIDSGLVPVHKLDWRADPSDTYWSIILPYLDKQL